MINNNYSAGLVSTSFKGAEKKGVDKAIKELSSVRKSIERNVIETERLLKDDFVALSDKLEAVDSIFSNCLAKVLKLFGY